MIKKTLCVDVSTHKDGNMLLTSQELKTAHVLTCQYMDINKKVDVSRSQKTEKRSILTRQHKREFIQLLTCQELQELSAPDRT